MSRIGVSAGLLLAALCLAAAAPADQPWKPAVCQSRASCRIVAVTLAGKAADGAALKVAEITLGLADKPADGPEEGCQSDNSESHDGGAEYWLIAGEAPPRRLLKLCNDGYGAAGIGQDTVKIGNNSLTYEQAGGSNDRWISTKQVRLEPPLLLSDGFCHFYASDPTSGATGRTDVATMTNRQVAIDGSAPHAQDLGDPCPALPASWSPVPGRALLAGWGVPLPEKSDAKAFPPGTPLGDCATHLGDGAPPGFTVFGTPDPTRLPELWLTALDLRHLIIQLYEPSPAPPGKSWVTSDHLEIWTTADIVAASNRPDPSQIGQIGIGLDGKVYAGVGNPPLPKVRRSEVEDAAGRKALLFEVAWEDDRLLGGVTIAYSQADAGKQARLYATAGIAHNRPSYLPTVANVAVRCSVKDGRWQVTENKGSLEDAER